MSPARAGTRRAGGAVWALLCAVACGGPECPLPEPTSEALDSWLREGCYATWAPTSAAVERSDMGPGGVRVYLSPALEASLTALADHPLGATAVREMYAPDLRTRVGWSASVKTADGWFWYERFDRQPRAAVASTSAPGCTGCHGAGRDYVQSTPWAGATHAAGSRVQPTR